MNKDTLNEAVKAYKEETREALQTVYDALNHGQQNKLLMNEAVKALFIKYEVNL